MPDGARSKMSVCILSRGCYPGNLRAAREARALRDDGIDVHVLCRRGDGETAGEDGVTVHLIGGRSPTQRWGRRGFDAGSFFFRSSFSLFVMFLRRRFDAVQVDNPPDSLVFAAILPRLFGARVVLRVAEPVPERIASGPLRWHTRTRVAIARAARRAAIAFAHRVVVSHREVREACGRDGADVNKIAVVVDDVPDTPALRPEFYDGRRDEIATVRRDERRRGEFRIVYHGAGGEGGGVDVLVRAVSVLRADVSRVSVRLIGARGLGRGEVGGSGSSVFDRARALAAELGVDTLVHYIGDLSLEAAAVEMLEADVVVEPAIRTPWTALVPPQSVFECASLGVAIVASRLESITSYFPDESVITFAPGDAVDLTRTLRHVFAHPEEAGGRVAAAAKVVETHRWEREQKKYLGVFHSFPGRAPGS